MLAKLLFYGDLHLHSKNYGAHRDYMKDSLWALRTVANAAVDNGVTHVIGLGDLTFGRFNNLEYRRAVEDQFDRINRATGNNHFQLKGNHDSAGYGMTEFEYYIAKCVMKPACNLDFGNVHLTMINYGEINSCQPNIHLEEGHTNIVCAHDYCAFSDTKMPNFGTATELDHVTRLFGMDILICGHIHTSHLFEGLSLKEVDGKTIGHRVLVDYPGSLTRPAYNESLLEETGHLIIITIEDDGSYKYDRLDIELPPIGETFNVEAKAIEKEKKEEKRNRVDISDVVKRLDEHERNVGNPEDIIMALADVPEKYKRKAIDLLQRGMK